MRRLGHLRRATRKGWRDVNMTMQRADIARELTLAESVISRKPVIPVLGCVVLETDGAGVVRLSATDQDLSLRSTCQAVVSDAGSAALPVRTLLEMVKSLADGSVKMVGTDANVAITTAAFRARLQTFPIADFPAIPDGLNAQVNAVLPAAPLRDAIQRVRFAVTENDKRFFMNGANMELRPGTFRLVSTDAHRLALVEVARDGSETDSVILPKKLLDSLVPLLEDYDGDVRYSRTEQSLFFTVGARTIISRPVDGTFPAYERILPKEHRMRVDVSRAAILDALRRAATVSDTLTRRVDLSLTPGQLTISSESRDVGDASESLAVEYVGEPFKVVVNNQFVRDFLEAAETDRVAFELNDEKSAIGLRAERAGFDYRYVVMPMVL